MKRIFWAVAILLSSASVLNIKAQTLQSSFEFLQYNPDVRSAGMGNTHLGSGNGMYLYGDPTAFGKSENTLYTSYSLGVLPKSERGRQYFNAFSAGYKVLPRLSILAGFRTQTGWKTSLIDNTGVERGEIRPYNWSIDLGSTWQFSQNWMGYVKGSLVNSYQGLKAHSVALSLGANYSDFFQIKSIPFQYSVTAVLNNFGKGLKYGNEKKEVELPTTAELGGIMSMLLSSEHKLSLAGLWGSELCENITNRFFGGFGLEYNFMTIASLRAGYHNRNNISTYSIGIGGQYKFASIDLGYLMTQRSEFNQFRLGLNVSF